MRTLRWLGVVALLLATAGCIKVDQTLTLNKDGSGTLDIRYGMSEQTIAQLEAMEQMSKSMGGEETGGDQDSPFDFDENKVREEFEADKPEGVELVSVASETVDGWKYMQLVLKFDDLASLKKTDFFAESDLSITKDAEGNYVLVQKSGAGDNLGTPDDEGMDKAMQQQMMQQMAAMFAGMRIATSIVVPTSIVETNATEVSGNKASWVFDIDKDPQALTKIEDMDLRVVFSADGVNLPEIGTD